MPTGIYPRPPIVAGRLRWLAPHIDGFKTWLAQRGYTAATVVEIVRLLSCWAVTLLFARNGL
jgi:integrase/recombinase XerD